MASKGRGMKRYMDRRAPSAFKIQITSMVDMFVILLVFLLKSYSTSPVNITPKEGLNIPESSSNMDPIDVVKLIVSKDGVFVEDQKVIELKDGKIDLSELDSNDAQFIRKLYQALDQHAEKAKAISAVNEEFVFDGQILLQADRDLNYDVLKRVMYTSMMAGYADVKLAVASK
jgi:biopolymer transport protein ExbD